MFWRQNRGKYLDSCIVIQVLDLIKYINIRVINCSLFKPCVKSLSPHTNKTPSKTTRVIIQRSPTI